ncbi:lipase lipl-1-like [Dermacentor albipictus]|uniref:lipase lipl-1-like n=1 Tax=Dermacentor albipictus TaxID=60249 RepID=UPI0038FC4E2A
MPIISPVLLAFDPLSKGGYLGSRLVSKMCHFVTNRLCPRLMTLTHLSSPLQLNKTRVPVYVGHWPRGTSLQNMRHYHQVYKAKNFIMYNHGVLENRRRYGQMAPTGVPS